MTLLQRAHKLTEDLQQLEKTKQLAQDVKMFNTRARELEDAVREFSNLVPTVKAFRSRCIPFVLSVDLVSLRKVLENITKSYQSDPNVLKNDSNLTKNFWNPLRNSPTPIYETLVTAWRDYANSILPRLDNELLGIFDKLPSIQTQVRTIRQLQNKANYLASSLPRSEHDIDELKGLVINIQTAWQGLQTTEIPASVLGFLKAACSGGAALHLFTEDVRQWLVDHQLNHAFSISLASSSYR